MTHEAIRASRTVTAAQAIEALPRKGRVAIGANAGEPRGLVSALAEGAGRFGGLEVVQVLSFGSEALVTPEARGHLRVNALFIGPSVREAVARGDADYTPVFLSEVPALFRPGGRLPLDAALVQVSPPDARGWCSLGVTVDVMRAAVDHAPLVIAEMNPRMPRTHGAAAIHISRIDRLVAVDHPLPELPPEPRDPVRERIADRVAELVGDGDTIQAGIGAIPEAVMARLRDRKDLGFHTELLSDGMMALVEAGVATGVRKPLWPGKVVTSFVLGSDALYRWCDDNAGIEMQPSDVTNDPAVIAAHPNLVAINSALSVDLTGQVNADSIGPRFYSGIGGQVDFLRGAARSQGGRPIVALPSTARGGTVSRIVGTLAPGAGVVTSRGDVHHVVTEWGRANLHGLSVRKRATALIAIAHPRFRDALSAEARTLGYLS
ncbi:MAG: acetyl-CoA hydrolase/transferase C-terminal domain-containing protein [Pseudomonadota bacterium]|nr:acetyl-CoA hydrolase/transferase C-terminal domain-containing protein [Pseudomonadota bacterium]